MQILHMDTLLTSFHITPKDLESRMLFQNKLPLLSKLLVEKFDEEYIQNNTEISKFFEHVHREDFLIRFQEFVIFVYSAKLNQHYVERVSHIGFLHAELKLDSAEVKYGFFGLSQILLKIAKVDPLIQTHLALLFKFLHMTEYIIAQSTQHKLHKKLSSNPSRSSIWRLDKIYSSFSTHKENYTQVKEFMHAGKEKFLDIALIPNDPSQCKFHTLLTEFENHNELLNISQEDLQELHILHIYWHSLITDIKLAYQNNDIDKQKNSFEKLTQTTQELHEIINKPLKEFETTSFLSLSSGLKAISFINTLFATRDLPLGTQEEMQKHVITDTKKALKSTLAWAIEEIYMDIHPLPSADYDLQKTIQFEEFHLYLAIRFKHTSNKVYLTEILTLVLEALELNFSIKERENSLKDYANKAQSANSAKDIFISNMSHELRTPLTAVNGYSEVLMLRPDTPENIRGYLKKINTAGNNLLDLVNTILNFAKLEDSRTKFKPTLNSIYLILQEVKLLSEPMAHKKNIELDIVRDLHLYLTIDPKLIKQVLVNLISNAIKFSPENSTVKLLINYDTKQKEYTFSVCDKGIGISQEDQKKLFHSFVQIDNIYQKGVSGSGLGLMICKKIIEELHRGKIWIKSEIDKGSCFHFSIPVLSTSANAYCINNAPQGAKHLLIVEDSHMYKRLFEEYLKDKFKLTFTDTNDGAKHILETESFDMIILDFYLTDGISSEVLTYMEEEDINIPVVVISIEDDLHVARTIYANNNLQSIINKKDIKEFCRVLNPKIP